MQHTKPRYPFTEAAKLLSLSRSKAYLRVKEGSLVPVYDGDAPYLTADEIDRYAALSHPKIDYRPPKSSAQAPAVNDGPAQSSKRRRPSAQSST